MKKVKILIQAYCISILCIFTACNEGKIKSGIDLDNIPKVQSYTLSSIFQKAEPLLLDSTIVIGEISKLLVTTDKFYILDLIANTINVFNHNGTFLSQIGMRGNGPGEYKEFSDIAIDTKSQRLYALDIRKQSIYIYNMQNDEYINNFNLSKEEGRSKYIFFSDGILYTDLSYNTFPHYLVRSVDVENYVTSGLYFKAKDYNKGWVRTLGTSPFFQSTHHFIYLPLFTEQLLTINNGQEMAQCQLYSKNFVTPQMIEDIQTSSPSNDYLEVLLPTNYIYNMMNYIENSKLQIFQYLRGNKLKTFINNKGTNSLMEISSFKNDLVYDLSLAEYFPPIFIASDSTHTYTCIQTNELSHFLDAQRDTDAKSWINKYNLKYKITPESNPIIIKYSF